MNDLNSKIKKIGSDVNEEERFEIIAEILAKMPYPVEATWYLRMITKRVGKPLNIIMAYQLGVIAGKRHERAKNKCGNECGQNTGKH